MTTQQQPLVSVIVPTKNSARTMEACLQSIAAQSYKNIEIIVVDNFSTDGTDEIAKKFTDKIYSKGPERSAQRNYGVQMGKGEYVVIIDSDMTLSPEVVSDGILEFQKNGILKGLVIPEESFGEGFWAKCKKLERSFYVGVDWMEAARFFDRKVFDEMNGYDDQNIGTEDYDLPQRMQEKYGKDCIGRIDSYIYHDEGKLELGRTCHKKFYYAQRLNHYLQKDANKKNFSNQSSILNRYMLFFKKPSKLLCNPVVGIGMLFMKTAEMTSGVIGYIWGKVNKVDNIY